MLWLFRRLLGFGYLRAPLVLVTGGECKFVLGDDGIFLVCAVVCRWCRGGVADRGFARVLANVALVTSLAAPAWSGSSITMVVGLMTPAVSFHRSFDAGENPSLLGTASMASFPS